MPNNLKRGFDKYQEEFEQKALEVLRSGWYILGNEVKEFEKEFGKQLFVQIELGKKSFCEANIPLHKKESKLTTEYQKIMATAKIPFDGKELNLYGVQKYFEHEDIIVMHEYHKAYLPQWGYLIHRGEKHEHATDECDLFRDKTTHEW